VGLHSWSAALWLARLTGALGPDGDLGHEVLVGPQAVGLFRGPEDDGVSERNDEWTVPRCMTPATIAPMNQRDLNRVPAGPTGRTP
jgi:hypothetical protein